MDNRPFQPYLSQILALAAVDESVDKSQIPVDGMWISRDLSTGWSFPQNYPQVYPQILPLLSTGLSTAHDPRPTTTRRFVHNVRNLSTTSVDKFANLWIIPGMFIHNRRLACGQVVDRIRFTCLCSVTKSLPSREGIEGAVRVNACF